MKKAWKKVISMLLTVSMFAFMTTTIFAQDDQPTELFEPKYNLATLEAFDYALLATGNNTSVKMNAALATINANIYSAGDFRFKGSQLMMNGECNVAGKIIKDSTYANIQKPLDNIVKMNVKDYTNEVNALLSPNAKVLGNSTSYYGNSTVITPPVEATDAIIEVKPIINDVTKIDEVHLPSSTITFDEDMKVKGDLKVKVPTLNLSSYIVAEENIEFNTSLIRTTPENPLILVSENGNITINSSYDNFNGIIYAPNGTVTVNTTTFNLNGKIIADKIVFESSSVTIKDNKKYANELLTIMPMLKFNSNDGDTIQFEVENLKANFSKFKLHVMRYDSLVKEETVSNSISTAAEKWLGSYRYYLTLVDDEKIKSNTVNYLQSEFGFSDIGVDYDGDGLSDEIEVMTANSNPYVKDTDDDGLNDAFESYMCYTDATKADTNGNGITDDKEDTDKDKLSNIDEYQYNTYPQNPDTDEDKLSDYDEIFVYGTDPLNSDTDGDTLIDGDEIVLGLNPLKQDTDDNGILDPDEKIKQEVSKDIINTEKDEVTNVTVDIVTNGNAKELLTIEDVYETDKLSANVVGLVGVPVEIKCESDFDKATITFKYDETKLGETKEENLAVMWYDKANNKYELLEKGSVINKKNNTVSYVTTHFSRYMLVDKIKWFEAWKKPLNYGDTSIGGIPTRKNYDIAYVIDVSGSMSGNPMNLTKQAANSFIDQMNSKDDGCLVTFESSARTRVPFGSGTNQLKIAVNGLYASGGTNVNRGLIEALNNFEKKPTSNSRMMILLCDGDVNYVQSTIDRAKNLSVKIYAVNLSSSSGTTALKKMASETGGEYYYATTSEDLHEQFYNVLEETVGEYDKTDTDGDGIADTVELIGMKLQNGQEIKTDPTQHDTDADGLKDGAEMGTMVTEKIYVGNMQYVYNKYFCMKSNPTKADSDGDGYQDKEDYTPMVMNPWMNYMFYEKGGDAFLRTEAEHRAKQVTNATVFSVNTVDGFAENWNVMGQHESGKYEYRINNVYTIFHGRPWSFTVKNGSGKVIDSYTMKSLDDKKIETLNLSSCNNGNLDCLNDVPGLGQNLAIMFLKRFEGINKVKAWDGSSWYFYGIEGTFSGNRWSNEDEFDQWSETKNKLRRSATGLITYTKDKNGKITFSPNFKLFYALEMTIRVPINEEIR